MTNVREVFVMQLARAAGKTANRFLRKRGLQKADRDDVIGAAMLWCWENRASYSLTTTLETWFMNAVRDAYKALQRAELPGVAESIDQLKGEDTTYNNAATESAVEALLKALTPVDREIATLVMEGYTYREIVKKGYKDHVVKDAHKRLKQLKRLVPDRVDAKFLARGAPTGSSDDAKPTLSTIDLELARLDFAPHAGKDCPPCWRCMWFEGFMPARKRNTRMNIAEKEVRDAVKATEERKIKIAGAVRYGGWRTMTI